MLRVILCVFLSCFASIGDAAAEHLHSLGEFAQDLMGPVALVGDFIRAGSLVLGSMCIFGALVRYKEHRVNPYAAPISTVITLLILGVILLGLPFIHLLLGGGLPYPHD